MTTMAQQKDIGAYLKTASEGALDWAQITAAAGNDNVEVNGNVIDILKAGRGRYCSAKLIIYWKAVLQDTKTLSIAANLRHDTDSGMSTDVADLYATRGCYSRDDSSGATSDADSTAVTLSSGCFPKTAVATGQSGGTTERGVVELDFDLSKANEYIQAQVTADLSASGTDTVDIGAILVFGGAIENPAV